MVKLNGNRVKTVNRGYAYLGATRSAPVNMRSEEHQFVIDGYLIDEVLKQIPPQIKIIQAMVCLIKRETSHRVAVPNNLRKLGVSYIRQTGGHKLCHVLFDATNKHIIQKQVKEVSAKTDFPYDRGYFKYVVLGRETTNCKFEHTTKEIRPDETDQRKKLRCLGATLGKGKVQELFQELGAKKFRCMIKEEPVKIVMCARE